MRSQTINRFPSEISRLRLRTITRLRWIAVAGQSVTILGVYYGLGFNLPIVSCFLIIGLSVALNLYLSYVYPATLPLKNPFAFTLLSYDLLQLSALLFLTGGAQNPFIILLMVPVIVSASTQPPLSTMILGLLAISAVTVLSIYSLSLPWFEGETLEKPELFQVGVWSSMVSAIVFTGVYARRIASETLQMSDALAATEMVLAREQKLSALDGLAAAAAHELGTPLSTISVIAKELERDLPADSSILEDIKLLKTQADRCRDILLRLAENDGESDLMHANISLTHLLREVIEEYSVFDKIVDLSVTPSPNVKEDLKSEPILLRNPGMLYGLGNIIENAVDFAHTTVDIQATWSDNSIVVEIFDDGPGIASTVLERLGEPYISSRQTVTEHLSLNEGMGLGYFIAKTLLERTGASLSMNNRKPPHTGAVVKISWLRSNIDINFKR